ncbi:nuclear transport factor 2 family protein [Nocardia rhamnosiphila]|uniref:Nuclear transport factor 2 family protein n=1 Tax=Nocardia rhamnosiphila TaxID=426716 RepID=A0ABV2WYA3_9NOCA
MERQVTDALRRFGRGAELWDRELLGSALAADAELDPRRATAAWSARSPRLIGRDTIVDILMGILAHRVDTTHAVGEPRVVVDGGRAHLRATVDAGHRLISDHRIRADITYLCTAELVCAGPRWLLRHIGIDTVRHQGDPTEIYCRAPIGGRHRLPSG